MVTTAGAAIAKRERANIGEGDLAQFQAPGEE